MGLQQNSTTGKGIYKNKTKEQNIENWAEDDVDKDDSSESFADTANATFVVLEILQWVNKKNLWLKLANKTHHCLGEYHVYI